MTTDTLVAGRELDALVADKVMQQYVDTGVMYMAPCPDTDCCDGVPVPEYSTDLTAAWTVVERLKYFVLRRNQDSWTVEYRDCGNPMDHFVVDKCCASVTADTAPLAICLAALKAVEA